jgi:hypothetical protein
VSSEIAGLQQEAVRGSRHASGASPQAALRGMAAMVCGLRYDDDNRLMPMEDATA